MAFGLSCTNDKSEFLLSSDLKYYGYVGRFSLNPIWIDNRFTSPDTGRVRTGWTYSIAWYCDIPSASRPVVTIDLPQNTKGWSMAQEAMGIQSIQNLGNGSWRVYVLATAGYTPPARCVRAFRVMSEVNSFVGTGGSANGIQLFDANGSRTFDSQIRPLLGAGTVFKDVWMTHARSYNQGWFYGYQTILSNVSVASSGTFIAGNGSQIWNGSWNYAESCEICYPLFSYSGNSVFMQHVPVFMTHPWDYNMDNLSGAFGSNGTYWATGAVVSTGPDYRVRTIVIDPALYP